jgi:hypothetical protein
MFSLKSIQMVQGSVCLGLRASCRVCARPSSKPSIMFSLKSIRMVEGSGVHWFAGVLQSLCSPS